MSKDQKDAVMLERTWEGGCHKAGELGRAGPWGWWSGLGGLGPGQIQVTGFILQII